MDGGRGFPNIDKWGEEGLRQGVKRYRGVCVRQYGSRGDGNKRVCGEKCGWHAALSSIIRDGYCGRNMWTTQDGYGAHSMLWSSS